MSEWLAGGGPAAGPGGHHWQEDLNFGNAGQSVAPGLWPLEMGKLRPRVV